jgi:glutaconate CoA-transferase, subunit A
VYGTRDHAEYVEKLGEEFWRGLAVGDAMSLPVNYGRRL